MAFFVEKENYQKLETLVSEIWRIAKTKSKSADKSLGYIEAQKERSYFCSKKSKFIISDITGKMISETLKENKIEITFDTLLSESADPSLWEYSSTELITIYSVGQRVFFSRYYPGQDILISENMVVSGVVNKFRNIFNYWF